MADSGPTTAGSIVGKLHLDRTQWLAEIAKTKEEAAELGRLRPTISVSTRAGEAIAELELVHAAAKDVAESNGALAISGQAVSAAETRVAATAGSAAAATQRLDAAQEQASASAAAMTATTMAAATAEEVLTAAVGDSEEAIHSDSEETERNTTRKGFLAAIIDRLRNSTVQANEANRTSATRMGLIGSAVALLLPLLPALGATAVGLAGSLTFMGVAGVLAIFGIKNAMEQGTSAGNAYSTGLQSLKGDFNALSQTSALAMLSSFQSIVRTTNSEMPLLNRNVQTFARILGTSGVALFDGSINALRVMEPLLIRVGVWVQQLAQGFKSWTSNGGLEKFTSYAISQLPNVISTLGALGNTVMHILQALAPLGTVGLAVLTGVSQAIAAIPVETLSSLIGAVTWGMLAFKAWGFIAPMLSAVAVSMGEVGIATQIATGPIGWITAAISALAAIFAVAMVNSQAAADAQANYTQAVQADTGVIGANVRASAAKALQDAGALKAYQSLGGSVKDLTDATLGNADAQARVAAVIASANATLEEGGKIVGSYTGSYETLSDSQVKTAQSVKTVTDSMSAQTGGIKEAIDAYNVYQAAVGGATIETDAQQRAVEANAAAAGVSVQSYLDASSSQGEARAQTEKTTAAMYLQNDAAGLLKQSLDLLNGKSINFAEAQNQFDSSITHMTSAIDEQTGAVDENRAALDSNTATGTEARGELINLVTAAQNTAQAFRDQGGSAEETKSKMETMKQTIIDNAVANGLNRDAVQQYIDKLFAIPAEIPPTQIEVDTAAAQARLESFIASMSGRVIDIQVNASNPNIGFGLGDGHADGGTIRGPGSASSDTAGLYPLSDGEEVISNRYGQADRFRGVLKQINAGSFDPSSFGSLRARGAAAGPVAAASSSSTSNSQTNHFTINEVTNPAGTAAAIARRQNMLVV